MDRQEDLRVDLRAVGHPRVVAAAAVAYSVESERNIRPTAPLVQLVVAVQGRLVAIP